MHAIHVQQLEKTYSNGVQALKGINLSVDSGDFYGLLGANGAGKTTMISILTGTVVKTGGKASIFDIDIDVNHSAAKLKVGVVPQEFNFNIFEKVEDILINQAGYFGVPEGLARQRTEQILKDLTLWDKRETQSMRLSGGMKRRLMIGRALVHQPELLILDEPTAGVDVELRHGMWEYLRELNARGTTILLTTHYLEEVEALCKNVGMIKEGEIVMNDSVKKILQSMEAQTYVLQVSSVPDSMRTLAAQAIHSDDPAYFDINVLDDTSLEVNLTKEQTVTDLIEFLNSQDVRTHDIKPKSNRLEQLFLNILND